MTALLRILFIIVFCLTNMSCYNALSGTSSTTTDAALYEDGIKALNSLDYDTAIAKFESLGTAYLAQTEVKMNYAGALAGKCGFNFINYFVKLGTPPSGSTFLFFMNQWKNISVTSNVMLYSTKRQYCVESEAVVKSIHPSVVGRDASQSLFLFLMGLAKIGMYLHEAVDPTSTGLGTGSMCLETIFPKTGVKEIGAGMGQAVLNLANISTVLSGASIDTTALTAACAAITPNPCSSESSADITDAMVIAIRTLLNFTATGVVTNDVICLVP